MAQDADSLLLDTVHAVPAEAQRAVFSYARFLREEEERSRVREDEAGWDKRFRDPERMARFASWAEKSLEADDAPSLSTLPPCDFPRNEGVLGALPGAIFRIPRSGPQSFPSLCREPRSPSLRFKKLQGAYPYWSVRFGAGYRAVCRRAGDKADWIWIGTDQDFDKTF